jgi:putative transposase
MTRICQTLGVSRSNLYEQLGGASGVHKKRIMSEDQKLLPLIRQITDERPTYGYRRITALLRKSLKQPINPKRTYRIMKEHSLLLQKHGKRPVRVHDGKIITLKSNLRWCSDHFSLQCWNADLVHVVFALDCHDREVISWMASNTGIDGLMIRDLMTDCIEARFGPIAHLPHNGPAYVARQTVSFARSIGFEVCTTAPYSPESNGMAEAFVKTFKRDYAHVADLRSAQHVLEQLPEWFEDYNNNAPHKGLKMLSPREYYRSSQEDHKTVRCNLIG